MWSNDNSDSNFEDIDAEVDTSSSSLVMNKFSKSESFKPRKAKRSSNVRDMSRNQRKFLQPDANSSSKNESSNIDSFSAINMTNNNNNNSNDINQVSGSDDTSGLEQANQINMNLNDSQIRSTQVDSNDIAHQEEEDDDMHGFKSENKNLVGLLQEEERARQQYQNEMPSHDTEDNHTMSKNLSPSDRKRFSPISDINISIGSNSTGQNQQQNNNISRIKINNSAGTGGMLSDEKAFQSNSTSSSGHNNVRMDLKLQNEDESQISGWKENVALAPTLFKQLPRGSTVKLRLRASMKLHLQEQQQLQQQYHQQQQYPSHLSGAMHSNQYELDKHGNSQINATNDFGPW